MIRASSKPTEPILIVGLLPPPSPHAPISAMRTAPRASLRESRMGQPPTCFLPGRPKRARAVDYNRSSPCIRLRLLRKRDIVAGSQGGRRPHALNRGEDYVGCQNEARDEHNAAENLTDIPLSDPVD